MNLGNASIAKLYLGTSLVTKIMLGTALAFSSQQPLRTIATENRIFYATNSRAKTKHIARARFTVAGDASEMVLNFANLWLNLTGVGATNTGNAITVTKVAVEKDGTSQFSPVLFAGGRSTTLSDGQYDVLSDPLMPSAFGLSKFSRGEHYWIRVELDIPLTTDKVPQTFRSTSSLAGTKFAWLDPAVSTLTNGVDGVGAFTVTGTGLDEQAYGYMPMMLGRFISANVNSFVCIGDSEHFGTGDTVSVNAGNGYGMFQRAMTAGDDLTDPLPSINLARLSCSTPQFNNDWIRSYYKYANILVDELGTNDIGLGTGNVTTIQNNLLAIYSSFKAVQTNGKIVRTYLLPRTTSTDSWATLENQANPAGWGEGQHSNLMNNWFDARKLDGTVNAVVGRSSMNDAASIYKWAVNGSANYMTADGLHPTMVGHVIRGAELRAVFLSV